MIVYSIVLKLLIVILHTDIAFCMFLKLVKLFLLFK